MPIELEKCVHAALGRGQLNTRHGLQQRHEGVATGFEVRHHAGRDVGRILQRHHTRFLGEHRGARGVELDQFAHVGCHGRGHDQPAQTPAGHQKALGKAVHHDQAVVGFSHIQKRRGAAIGRVGFVIQALIHLVGQHPGAGAAAVRQDLGLLGAAECPACGVVGRVDDEHSGGGCDGGFERGHVQLPLASHRAQRHAFQIRPHDQRLRRQVGPDGRDGDHLIACVNQGLRGQHQGVHAARGDGEALHANGSMQGRHVVGYRLAQLGQTQVVRIKGLAFLHRIDGRLAHDVGRDLVGLAKPEGQHIRAAHARVGHFADAGLFQVHDGLAHERRGVWVHASIVTADLPCRCHPLHNCCACL